MLAQKKKKGGPAKTPPTPPAMSPGLPIAMSDDDGEMTPPPPRTRQSISANDRGSSSNGLKKIPLRRTKSLTDAEKGSEYSRSPGSSYGKSSGGVGSGRKHYQQPRHYMQDKIRAWVSKKKRRYREGGYDLDLAYVTPRIVAMGFPAVNVEATYRNSAVDVEQFLDTHHGQGNYKLYNLCAERTYPPDRFHGDFARYPFEDHNPPPLGMMLFFCRDVDDLFTRSQDSVAAIHCKAGKGRTGVMICAYLLWAQEWDAAEEALQFYAFARTANLKGVTIPSQRRFVQYFEQCLHNYSSTRQKPHLSTTGAKRKNLFHDQQHRQSTASASSSTTDYNKLSTRSDERRPSAWGQPRHVLRAMVKDHHSRRLSGLDDDDEEDDDEFYDDDDLDAQQLVHDTGNFLTMTPQTAPPPASARRDKGSDGPERIKSTASSADYDDGETRHEGVIELKSEAWLQPEPSAADSQNIRKTGHDLARPRLSHKSKSVPVSSHEIADETVRTPSVSWAVTARQLTHDLRNVNDDDFSEDSCIVIREGSGVIQEEQDESVDNASSSTTTTPPRSVTSQQSTPRQQGDGEQCTEADDDEASLDEDEIRTPDYATIQSLAAGFEHLWRDGKPTFAGGSPVIHQTKARLLNDDWNRLNRLQARGMRGCLPPAKLLAINKLVFRKLRPNSSSSFLRGAGNGTFEPVFKILCQDFYYDSQELLAVANAKTSYKAPAEYIEIPLPNAIVVDEVCVIFYTKRHKKAFKFWFHTAFIKEYVLTLSKSELDGACKDKKHVKFDANFHVEVHFTEEFQ